MLNVIEGLPLASHFGEARAMDEELAELTADLKPSGPPVLPVSEATASALLLTEAVSLLRSLVQQGHGKKIPFQPLPAPQTARQIVAERRRDLYRGRLLLAVAEAQERYEELQSAQPQPRDERGRFRRRT